MVKEALVPFLYEIFLPNLVAFWNSFRYFLSSPLYICIIINSVVLLIAATSSTSHNNDHDHDHDPPPRWVEVPHPEVEEEAEATTLTLLSTRSSESTSSEIDDCIGTAQASSDIIDEMKSEAEEGESECTMESTWKTIVEGQSKKLSKSESVPPRRKVEEQKVMRKLETFNDRASIRRLGGLRRDPSVDVEAFNKQVEAFINKFNQDMRLQRQESDQRFLDMIKRGL
ncbi:uncharacterized protein LOC125195144 [Salvia hispanica]|uniref:uncharacterized protein LOC125195144 n=1 Tax=Salvia hispanica TaxID=49212 RepID=UPI0020091683|nr:uncharacterized protein LOC125195144 [Salvia hispanica]